MKQTAYFKVIFWVTLTIIFGVFVSAISNVLLPFVVGLLVAYFLDPVADKIEATGVSRTLASLFIVVLFCVLLLGGLGLLLPVVIDQATRLLTNIPNYITDVSDKYAPRLLEIINNVDESTVAQLKASAQEYSKQAVGLGTKLAGGLWKSGMAFLNLISLVFISPIVAFYLLRDWDRIVAKIDGWLPRKHAKVIREQVKLIDLAIAGFVRGQTNVCLLLAVFYAAGLSFLDLNYGILIGLLTGLLSFIPYVGMLIGMVTGLSVAFFQSHDISYVLMVAGVFAAGQFTEGNFITPKLVGDKVGLHPVWIIFALLVGAVLFGFVGVLLAVPVAAIVGVLVRFSLSQYLQSSLYTEKASASKRAGKKRK